MDARGVPPLPVLPVELPLLYRHSQHNTTIKHVAIHNYDMPTSSFKEGHAAAMEAKIAAAVEVTAMSDVLRRAITVLRPTLQAESYFPCNAGVVIHLPRLVHASLVGFYCE